jgi:integrase
MSRYPRMPPVSQRDRSVMARFVAFCVREGVDSPACALYDEAVVAAFLTIGCRGLKAHSLGTYRSVLARISETRYWSLDEFSASVAPRPYSSKEVAALWSMAQNQSSPLRIERAKVLLAAMLGAGLRPGELARAKRCDVVCFDTFALIVVRGSTTRALWVLSPYGGELARLADGTTQYLFRPGATVRDQKNLVGEVCARLVRDPDEVSLLARRARATFICSHLQAGTPLLELCGMAGLKDVESLLRYARHVDGAPSSKAQLRALAARS